MARNALSHSARVSHAFVQGIQELVCLVQQGQPCAREFHAALVANEKRIADVFFQPFDCLTERRLCHVQSLCGAAEMQLLGNNHKLS